MDIQFLQPIQFQKRLDAAYDSLLSISIGASTMLGGIVAAAAALGGLGGWIGWHFFSDGSALACLALIGAVGGGYVSCCVLDKMTTAPRFMLVSEARAVIRARRSEFKSLSKRIAAFNKALAARKSLDEGFQKHISLDLREADAAQWSTLRDSLNQELENLLRPLLAIKKFKDDAKMLRSIEDGLSLSNVGESGASTQELSSFVATTQFRQQLETEMVELGLPLKSLPPIKTAK